MVLRMKISYLLLTLICGLGLNTSALALSDFPFDSKPDDVRYQLPAYADFENPMNLTACPSYRWIKQQAEDARYAVHNGNDRMAYAVLSDLIEALKDCE